MVYIIICVSIVAILVYRKWLKAKRAVKDTFTRKK